MKKIFLLMLAFVSFISFTFAESQLNTAISWMNSNWLTKFTNAITFMSTKNLRRDEATKFFVQYATEIVWLTPDISKTSCNFNDLNNARPDLKDLIKESCQLDLFQWNNGQFMPNEALTNAQAITVLIRMIDGKKDETQWHFAQAYFEKAQELGIMNWLTLNSTTNFDKLTTRWEVGILLYNTSKINKRVNEIQITNTNNENTDIVHINEIPSKPIYTQQECDDEVKWIIPIVEQSYLSRWNEFQDAKMSLFSNNCYSTRLILECDNELSNLNVERQNKITDIIKNYKKQLNKCEWKEIRFSSFSNIISGSY